MKPTPDWNRAQLLGMPAFAPLHPVLACMGEGNFPALDDLNAMLAKQIRTIRVQEGHVLRFVPQEYGKLPFERQYEPRCFLHGEVPTREQNWHDLLNAMVWLAFPKAKAAINLRHYHALTTEKTPGRQRGAGRDMLTLLDESGVIVPCADLNLAGMLRKFEWKELFWHRRSDVRHSMGYFIFGHGLYEKAMNPYVGMTGQGLLLPVAREFFSLPLEKQIAHLDEILSAYLLDEKCCRETDELTPVPLLGVPGWTDNNETETFYDNTAYFRKGKNGHRGA